MSSITVEIPQELLLQVERVAREEGYETPAAFIQSAVEEKLYEQRRQAVVAVTDRIRDGLEAAGHTPEEILEDFERFRRARNSC
jgi:Arc/MetJ-type ribon-helix-helix transcriptional regulator